jgi:hypothetical protein
MKRIKKHIAMELMSAIYLAMLIVSVMAFFIGYHNVDLSVNFMRFEERYDIDLVDMTLGGKIVELEEGYRMGHIYMIVSFLLGMWSFGGLMSIMTILLNSYKKEQNK